MRRNRAGDTGNNRYSSTPHSNRETTLCWSMADESTKILGRSVKCALIRLTLPSPSINSRKSSIITRSNNFSEHRLNNALREVTLSTSTPAQVTIPTIIARIRNDGEKTNTFIIAPSHLPKICQSRNSPATPT
ncbi:MAG: hypothetical protein U0L45_06225 [Alistipes sp.]|nr:hypothetical protein [Alistipes sp.]